MQNSAIYITQYCLFLTATVFTTQGRTGRRGVVQRYIVPKTGCYELTLLGAAGGTRGNIRPCRGAKVVTKVTELNYTHMSNVESYFQKN